MKTCDDSYKGQSGFLQGSQKVVYFMPANEVLQEARKLHKVSDSLDALAEQHAPSSEAFVTPPHCCRCWLCLSSDRPGVGSGK